MLSFGTLDRAGLFFTFLPNLTRLKKERDAHSTGTSTQRLNVTK